MKFKKYIVQISLALIVAPWIGCTQSIDNYLGGWQGTLESQRAFKFELTLDLNQMPDPVLLLEGEKSTTKIPLTLLSSAKLGGAFENQMNVKIDLSEEKPTLSLEVGHHLCFIELIEKSSNYWSGSWTLFTRDQGPGTFLMALDKNSDGSTYASIFFEEPTFHYLFAENFLQRGQAFSFNDRRSGLEFAGTMNGENIAFQMQFLLEKIDLMLVRRSINTWNIGKGSSTSDAETVVVQNPVFGHLINDIRNGTLERTHAVIIAKDGKTILEHYFDYFSPNALHDTRSLAKSFASSMVGIAIDDQLLENEFIAIKPYFDKKYPTIDWSDSKDAINLFHLMTMSSGLDAIDFGLNRNSFANESTYQSRSDWTRHILEAPMVKSPGSEGNYGSGSPHLVGPILSSLLDQDLSSYIHKKLFLPLEILEYRIQLTNQNNPYFGGGWYLKPTDLLRFGQLYLNKGRYKGRQILSDDWVTKSIEKHTILENSFDKNPYGFLFWHKSYSVGNRKIDSIEARGAGGQYLFIVPELDLVAVITSGNYTNNKAFQPERIMQDYILKELIK